MIGTYQYKVVNAIPAVDGNNTALESDIISMKGYDHATFILSFGIVDTLASANTSTGAETNLIAFKGENVTTCDTAFIAKYRAELDATADTLGTLTELPVLGVSMGAARTLDIQTGGNFIVVEIDATDLAPSIATPYDTIKIGFRFSAHSVLLSAVCVLSKGRYKGATMPTAITN